MYKKFKVWYKINIEVHKVHTPTNTVFIKLEKV